MAANLTRCLLLESKVSAISKTFFSTSSILNWRTREDAERNKTPEYVRKDEYYYQQHPSDEWLEIREEKGLLNCKILRDKPDYSYVDGRTPILTPGQKRKLDKQKMFCEKIVALSNEMDLAKEIYQEQLRQKQEVIDQRLSMKLKPKGVLLKAKGERLSKPQEKTRKL